MSAFCHVSLRDHKGVHGGELLDLGKVNIIAGANNSGKSTVLECLADAKLHYRGVPLSDEHVAGFETAHLGGQQWTQGRFSPSFQSGVRDVIRTRKIWYAFLSQILFDETSKLFQERVHSTLNAGQGFNRQLNELIGGSPKAVLVPAKRRLDSSAGVNSSEEIKSDGGGVLNFLFAAKNSQDDSPRRKQYDSILELFRRITGDYDFDVFMVENNEVNLRFRRKNGSWLGADACGLGFRDLLIILYFSLAAEADVVLLEEPENHLHPEMQRRLIRLLREFSPKQFFLSTHSNVFLSTEFADRVFNCRLTDSVKIENATSRAVVLTELGYSISDNLVSDLVILCEGPKDKPVLEELLAKRDLTERFRIKIWPLGGDIMSQVDLSVFQESYKINSLNRC